MEIGNWKGTRDLNEIYNEARELGLEANIAELDNFGFTVIEDALSPELNDRCADAILRVIGERTKKKVDAETGDTHPGMQLAMGLLFEDRCFEEALMTPSTLCMMSYLLGRSFRLSTVTSHLKSSGGPGTLPIHADNGGQGLPAPFAPYAQIANCNYVLTDYTEIDDGVLAIVPGSHKLNRYPQPHEMDLQKNKAVIPVFAPKGSAIIWVGGTFHGSYPRRNPGWRINLANLFCREYMDTSEDIVAQTTPEMLARNNERFAKLMGVNRKPAWTRDNPSLISLIERGKASASQWA